MDADETSWKSDASTGQSDARSAGQYEPVGPNADNVLLQLSNHFQQSKSQQIQQFLRDQEELNRRFGEETNDDDDSSIENGEKSLQETELRLKQRLALHRHPSADRAKTSMGFYNKAEFTTLENGEEGCSDTSSVQTDDSRPQTPSEIDYHHGYARPLTPPRMIASVRLKRDTKETVRTQLSAEHHMQPPKVLQPILRPKTSMGRRSAIRSQILTIENKFSHETTKDPNTNANTGLQHERQSTLLGNVGYHRSSAIRRFGQGSFSQDNKRLIDYPMRLLAVSDINCRYSPLDADVFDDRSRALRHENNALCHENNDHVGTSKFLPETSHSVPPGLSSLSGLPHRRMTTSLTHSAVVPSEPRNQSSLDRRLWLERNSRKAANGLNTGDLHYAHGTSNLKCGRSRRGLAVHRLPPLDSTVPGAASGRNILDPAC